MAYPNVGDIIATTIDNRSRQLADNITNSTALLLRLSERGNINFADGGVSILQELMFAENNTFGYYSGYDEIDISPSEVFDYAEYGWKQAAVAVSVSGRDEMINSGREKMIDLVASRVKNAEITMKNNLGSDIYSDGTGSGGKQITGLDAAIPEDPTTGTYGGINRALWTFWRTVVSALTVAPTKSTIIDSMNGLYFQLTTGTEYPDLVVADSIMYGLYVSALQGLVQLTNPKLAELGFANVKYINADVVLDGGIGGSCPDSTMFFINTNYAHWRPHKDKNMVPLAPDRFATNQDAYVKLLGFGGNFTLSGSRYHGRLYDNS